MVVVGLVTGCDRSDDLEFDNATSSINDLEKNITMGFNLVFTGEYLFQGPAAQCGDYPPFIRILNVGEGNGTHFGKVISYFDFCVDVTDSSYPNAFEEAYFEDENGDKLYVYVEGFVYPGRLPGMPSFALSYFKDPFVITGGTGRFEGATGSGETNDYNFFDKKDLDIDGDPIVHTQHHWTGTITLKK